RIGVAGQCAVELRHEVWKVSGCQLVHAAGDLSLIRRFELKCGSAVLDRMRVDACNRRNIRAFDWTGFWPDPSTARYAQSGPAPSHNELPSAASSWIAVSSPGNDRNKTPRHEAEAPVSPFCAA